MAYADVRSDRDAICDEPIVERRLGSPLPGTRTEGQGQGADPFRTIFRILSTSDRRRAARQPPSMCVTDRTRAHARHRRATRVAHGKLAPHVIPAKSTNGSAAVAYALKPKSCK